VLIAVGCSGHYDSRNTDVMNFVDDAPGADDDGDSGDGMPRTSRDFPLS